MYQGEATTLAVKLLPKEMAKVRLPCVSAMAIYCCYRDFLMDVSFILGTSFTCTNVSIITFHFVLLFNFQLVVYGAHPFSTL